MKYKIEEDNNVNELEYSVRNCYIVVYIILQSISNDRINLLFIKHGDKVKIQTSERIALYSQTTTDELVMVMRTYWLVMAQL